MTTAVMERPSTQPNKSARDTKILEAKREVKYLLQRSNVEVKRTVNGKIPTQPTVSLVVTGKGVESAFNRYYLNTKLVKLGERHGFEARTRHKERGTAEVFVDLKIS